MKTPTLLLVDDDEVVLATFGRGLRDAGFAVKLASSGAEALMTARRASPDLAILDLRMPEISGTETAALMREIGIPVIFLSAYDDHESVAEAARQGALGYLIKPIDVARALPTIKTALERACEIRELARQKDRLTAAVGTGRVVNVAIGILMERHRMDHQEAFEVMRERSRRERRKIREVASDVLDACSLVNALGPRERPSDGDEAAPTGPAERKLGRPDQRFA
ncbi:ANTAR domain-containing response regulator [Thiocystis violascens]|uniref:Response regulator with CheY-like receiver, AAA-type ATPase, and DNA-binding domains n=1 Tax=Thiocystis violascens (strain ATCC 17096 / DSM 198 / 6111) TaxID=765911 RepID=I3YBL5_THIV6|nr:response regulator [Thiocystis violascens]AFL74383.1 response regulator with CheY-like receiver, AAA-type ATPase, and DNA-binding domains [Thiocystis violascens DSM 198]